MWPKHWADSLMLAGAGFGLSLGGAMSQSAGVLGGYAVLGMASFAFVLSALAACFAVRDLRRPALRRQAMTALALCALVYVVNATYLLGH